MAVVSPENSSDQLLAAGGTFQGEFVKVANYATVSVLIHSNAASATNGLHIEWSTDAENVDDRQSFNYAGSASGLGLMVMATVRAAYVRIRYVNSSLTAQTFMRLQTLLHDKPPSASISYIGQPVTANDDALLTKSVLAARRVDSPQDVVMPFATGDPFLIVEHPPNRATLIENTVSQSTSSQQLDFFGLFGGTRRVMTVFNDSTSAALKIRFGSAASQSDWSVKLRPQCLWELPLTWGLYSGTVHGVWESAGSGTAKVVEFF